MARRGYHLVLFADYLISAAFAFLVFAVSATSLAATGSALDSSRTQAVSNVYASMLLHIEDGARALRADYCARGNVESGPLCGDPELLLGAPDGPQLG